MYRIFQRMVHQLEAGGIVGFVGDPPNAVQPPYVFVWGHFPVQKHTTMAEAVGVVDTEVNATCVAESPANALKLASQVEAMLSNFSPNIVGWFVEPLRVVGSVPLHTETGSFDAGTNRLPAAIVLRLRVRATTRASV